MHLIRPCQHAPTRYCISCISAHTRPCIFAQSMVYACVAIDVLAPMCWHVISGACMLGHAVAMHPCLEYGLCSSCHRCASTYVLALALVCSAMLLPIRVRVCQCVCLGLCPGMRVTRAHTADVLADFCDGDVAPRSQKRSRRLPHAHLRVRIRMRVRARSCVRESLCLHSHMYAHA